MSSRRVRIALAIVAGFIALFFIADFATSSPALCGSCHEMEPRTERWQASAHAAVKCTDCHQEPTEWYQAPQALVARSSLLARDVVAHFSSNVISVETSMPAQPVTDDVCLQCHDVNREATSGYRIKIEHAEHAERNGSCVSCHIDTAHPLPSRGRALSLMGACFKCHGTAEQPEAPAECDACHPDGFDLLPASHGPQAWKTEHGRVADADKRQCVMCHEQKSCDDCHGVEMPHPAGWEKGPTGHAVFAKTNRAVCEQCHTEKPDLCSMCHHRDQFDPTKGAWVQQHFLQVRQEGSEFCMRCHQPNFCVSCHVQWATEL